MLDATGVGSVIRKMRQNVNSDPSETFDFQSIRKIDKFKIISGFIKRNLEFRGENLARVATFDGLLPCCGALR